MKLIVNADRQWNIGNGNELVFHIPEDMKFFRASTLGKTVIMGRKTLDSFPGGIPLKNRENIVLTRDENFLRDGAVACHSVDEVLKKVKNYNTDDIFVIGGEKIYSLFLDKCDTALVTRVDALAKEADKKFPDLSLYPEWKLISKSETKEYNGIKFNFCEYRREC